MRRRIWFISVVLAMCVVGIVTWKEASVRASSNIHAIYRANWNPQAAAGYLDRREVWWQNWPAAKMDHGTICISCHTVVPYAMIRTTLNRELHETGMPEPEKILLDNVEKRVKNWPEMTSFYSDSTDGPGKTAESHATEAVLNAVILTSFDTQHGHLRPITQEALDEAWALQEASGENAGGWKWQDFRLAPWESGESAYQGAALLLLEIENAPDGYASEPQTQVHLQQLEQYLRRQYATQPLVNHIYILWLSSKLPSLLPVADRKALLEAIEDKQRSDGGWSLSSLDPRSQKQSSEWPRLKEELKEVVNPDDSDGYATGLVVVTLEDSGTDRQDKTVRRGIEWLERHQENDGSWWAHSLNEKRDPQSDIGRFMRDAATSYAVIALENKPSSVAVR